MTCSWCDNDMEDTPFTSESKDVTEFGDYSDENMRSPTSDVKHRRFRIVVCVVCVATTCISIVLVIVTAAGPAGQSQGVSDSSAAKVSSPSWSMPEVCTDCFKLVKNPFNPTEDDPLMAKVTKRIDTGTWLCCASTLSETSAMLEMMLRGQETMPVRVPKLPPDKQLKFTPASAHKRLLAEPWDGPVPNFPKENHVILRMDPDYNENTEHHYGINVTENAMVIQYTGLYYIYNSVFYKPKTAKPAGQFDVQRWNHYIHLTRPNLPAHSGSLLKTSHTACDNCIETQDTTFAGGIFHLQAGDIIQVCVSGHGLVEFTKESTYVGMFMLSSGE